jgi:hypothetical protein
MENLDKRKELKEKLHQKIAQNKLKNNPIGPNAERKIQKEIDAEKKLIDNDKRINQTMKKLYINAIASSPNIDKIDNPVYILDNMELVSIKFYKFLEKFILVAKTDVDDWKKEMIGRSENLSTIREKEEYMRELDIEYARKLRSYLLTPYISYISHMTNINVFG